MLEADDLEPERAVRAQLLIPATAALLTWGCGRTCDFEGSRCDGEVAVACVDGEEKRTPCGDGAYCNYGECNQSAIRLPQDAGPHLLRTEWWYYTGHLSDGQADWGFEVAIFQYDLNGYFGYMCHVAITDETAGRHFHTDGFDLSPEAWSPEELVVLDCRFLLDDAGNDRVLGVIPAGQEKDGHPGEWIVDLQLEPMKRVAFHGTDGIIPMSAAGSASWYYSYTRLRASGTLTTPDTGPVEVSGQAWMDHQWGDFDIVEFKGWDWWSMQFTDGHEIMLFTFRDWDGDLACLAGTIVDPDGMLTALEDFSITSLRTWESPHTDGVYPLDWDIHIAPMDWDLKVRTHIDDQEMHNIAQSYWEGSTTITGTRGGSAVQGVGYTELTGYATDLLDP